MRVRKVVLKRGQGAHVEGRRILVVDDVVNAGFSIRLPLEAVSRAGGEVAGVAEEELGVAPYVFLDEVSLPSWPAEACRLCAQGTPVNTQYAHGAEFVADR